MKKRQNAELTMKYLFIGWVMGALLDLAKCAFALRLA